MANRKPRDKDSPGPIWSSEILECGFTLGDTGDTDISDPYFRFNLWVEASRANGKFDVALGIDTGASREAIEAEFSRLLTRMRHHLNNCNRLHLTDEVLSLRRNTPKHLSRPLSVPAIARRVGASESVVRKILFADDQTRKERIAGWDALVAKYGDRTKDVLLQHLRLLAAGSSAPATPERLRYMELIERCDPKTYNKLFRIIAGLSPRERRRLADPDHPEGKKIRRLFAPDRADH